MADSKWGTKRLCLGCGKRFYDMRRDPIICPGCEVPFEVGAPTRTRRQGAPVERAAVLKPPVAAAETEDGSVADQGDPDVLAVADDDSDDDDVEEEAAEAIEDPSELGEDEDDMAEVIVGIEAPEKVDN
ncbi:MAG: TIGR02300 family protein [Proteobacteria bacterium]|nr:TIGR02300 family protein [Pseudomonadota bacterium]MDA1356740.1 TIGR02300 family protein [Pseudomonadota bacterium]